MPYGMYKRKGYAVKLLMFNDVFADFVNGIMFHGKDVVKEDELVDLSGWSHYKGDDSKHRFQDRDVVKLWKEVNIRQTA